MDMGYSEKPEIYDIDQAFQASKHYKNLTRAFIEDYINPPDDWAVAVYDWLDICCFALVKIKPSNSEKVIRFEVRAGRLKNVTFLGNATTVDLYLLMQRAGSNDCPF